MPIHVPLVVGGVTLAAAVAREVVVRKAADLITGPATIGGSHTPEHALQIAMMQMGATAEPDKTKKKRKNPFNKIVSVELKKLKGKKGTQRNKFKLAISRAKRIHNAAKKKKSK